MDRQACPNCKEFENEIFIPQAFDRQWNLARNKFDYLKCKNCELVFISPFPSLVEINSYYPSSKEYYAYNLKSIPNNYRLLKKYSERRNPLLRAQVHLVFPFINFEKPGKVLDLGCGVGHFLDGMKALGWETWGIEISDEATATAALQHKVYKDLLALKNYVTEGYFDLITSFQSIEHLPNPTSDFFEIHNLLNNKGMIYINTPNTDCNLAVREKHNWRGLECPRHLCLYNPNSIKLLLSRLSFSQIQIRTRNAPSDLIGTYSLKKKSLPSFFPRKAQIALLAPWVLFSIIMDRGKGNLLEVCAKK